MTTQPNTIESLADAITKIKALEGSEFASDDWEFHRFPFWLWFRGQSRVRELEPPVFRRIEVRKSDTALELMHLNEHETWDETNLFNHLKLRVPGQRQSCHSAFDWLCLMQHYSLPTRLLDWSESILPALYFAVKDHLEEPGELFILNARRLNLQSKARPTLSIATDPLVAIRAEMADVRSLRRLKKLTSVTNAANLLGMELDENNEWVKKFLNPIAVIPNRLNDRMIFQASVFTLHGGKKYPEQLRKAYGSDSIPDPVSLQTMNASTDERQCVFMRYLIPSDSKREMLRDLVLLGIHEGTLFPEVDRQAAYLKSLWRFENNPVR